MPAIFFPTKTEKGNRRRSNEVVRHLRQPGPLPPLSTTVLLCRKKKIHFDLKTSLYVLDGPISMAIGLHKGTC